MNTPHLKARLKAWRQTQWNLAEAERVHIRDEEDIKALNRQLKALERGLLPWVKIVKWPRPEEPA